MQKEFLYDKTPMEQILREESWGVLVTVIDGLPYSVPLNYGYVDGTILFHCALEGRKLDAIRSNPDVCFVVARQEGPVTPHPGGKPCHSNNASVICTGRALIAVDPQERKRLLNACNRVFRPDAAELELDKLARCAVVAITVDEMTGRREQDRKTIYWRHTRTQ